MQQAEFYLPSWLWLSCSTTSHLHSVFFTAHLLEGKSSLHMCKTVPLKHEDPVKSTIFSLFVPEKKQKKKTLYLT